MKSCVSMRGERLHLSVCVNINFISFEISEMIVVSSRIHRDHQKKKKKKKEKKEK